MRSTNRFLLALSLLAAGAPSLRAAPTSDADLLADLPGIAEGDPDATLDALVGIAERDGKGPLAQAALVESRGLWHEVKDPAPYVRRLEALLKKGLPQGDAEEAVRRTLGDRYLESGDAKARAAVGVDAGYLGRFLVCGPFGLSARAAVDALYPPEAGIDLEKEMAGSVRPVRWMAWRNLGIGDLVEPFEILRPTDGVAYALAQVKVPARGPAVLKMNCRAAHKVFLNGVEILRRDRLLATPSRTAWVPVTLAEGWNRILVKTVGSAGFALKVCDAERGRPLEGLEVEEGRVLHPLPPALPAPGSVAYRSNLDAVLGAEPAGPGERVLRAVLARSYDLEWDAYVQLEAAAKEAPANAGILFRFASYVQTFREMPEPRWRKNRARSMYEDVLEKSPGHAAAVLELASILSGEDRTEEALAGLKPLAPAGDPAAAGSDGEGAKAAAATRAALERSHRLFPGLDALLKAKPGLAAGWWARCGFCSERRWTKEAEDAARRALEVNPRHMPSLRFLLRVADGFGNAAASEEACRRILAVDRGDASTMNRLAAILRAKGERKAAEALLLEAIAAWPTDSSLREELARARKADRDYDGALAVYAELEAISPLEEEYPRKAGEILRLKGDADGARKAWERSLALDGSQGNLRRELDRMAGAEFDFARKWEVDGVALAKECGGQEKYPKAVAVHVLDYQCIRVNDDGSWTAITHDVHKILNEKGREKYSDTTVPGTLLEVRAISPEGEVFLPIAPRGNTFTLEGLQGGWIVETRYFNDNRKTGKGFDSGGWYFQDPQFGADADPVVLSRLVVDMPASMEVPLRLRNYGAAPVPTVEAGRKIWLFEKKDQDRIEEEPRMPGPEEICPSARFCQKGTWEDVNLECLEALDDFLPSPLIDAKVREILAGVEGRAARAKALYDWVNREILGNSGGWGPTGVLLERSGNRYALFGAMLRSAGIPFDPVRVANDDGSSEWEFPSSDLFAEQGIVIRAGEPGGAADDVYVFPFARHTPFGRIPASARWQPALVPAPAGPTLFRMPTGSDADLESAMEAVVTLGATPADTTFSLKYADPNDSWYGFKERVKDMNEDDRKKNTAGMVGRFFEAADLRTWSFPGLEEAGVPYRLEATGALPQILRGEAGAMVLPLGLDTLEATNRFIERPERVHPYVLQADQVRRDRITYELGGKWRVKSLPRAHTAISKVGTYSLTVGAAEGRVTVERRIRFGRCRYSPDEYREFVAWCRELDAAEEQRVVLEEAR